MYCIYCVKQSKKPPEGDVQHSDCGDEELQRLQFKTTEEVFLLFTCVFQFN